MIVLENGRTSSVGKPRETVLISKIAGRLASFLPKYTSQLVTNAPSSLVWNVCARGSCLQLLTKVLSSVRVCVENSALLVDTILSCMFCRVPLDVNVVSATDPVGSGAVLLVELDVRTN